MSSAFTTRLASPSVYTDSGTSTKASAGQTSASTNPITSPANNASRARSISKSSSNHAVASSAIASTNVVAVNRPTT